MLTSFLSITQKLLQLPIMEVSSSFQVIFSRFQVLLSVLSLLNSLMNSFECKRMINILFIVKKCKTIGQKKKIVLVALIDRLVKS